MESQRYSRTVDGAATAFLDTRKVPDTLRDAAIAVPELTDHIMAVILSRHDHYSHYARLLQASGVPVNLSSPAMIEYMVYRLVAASDIASVQRLRRFLGEQNLWRDARARAACQRGFLHALQNMETTELSVWVMDGLNDLCRLWDNATPEMWTALTKLACAAANPKMWEYVATKYRKQGNGSLHDGLNDDDKRACCLRVAASTNSKFFEEMYLKMGGVAEEWFQKASATGVLHEAYRTAAANGRLRMMQNMLQHCTVPVEVHLQAVLSAAYCGQRNVVTEYEDDRYGLQDDTFPLLQWTSVIFHRGAIFYDLSRMAESSPALADLLRLVQVKEADAIFENFDFADFAAPELVQHEGWSCDDEPVAELLAWLVLHNKRDAVLAICETQNVTDAARADCLDAALRSGAGCSAVFYDRMVQGLPLVLSQWGTLLTAVLVDAVETQNDELFFKYVRTAPPAVVDEAEKHPVFCEGSIYRTALLAQHPTAVERSP